MKRYRIFIVKHRTAKIEEAIDGMWVKFKDYKMDVACLKERIKELEEKSEELSSALEECQLGKDL